MTWTKLGEEFPDEARGLTDAAFRTHVEALCWSNRRGLDLRIPRRDLRRFAETDDPDTAVKVLIDCGWWKDDGDAWLIDGKFPDWQIESAVIAQRREAAALRVKRHRLHKIGDHSICLEGSCNALRNGLPGTERNGTVRTGSKEGDEENWPTVTPPGAGQP
jgi:hypothetical protein